MTGEGFSEKDLCYHCGDPCASGSVHFSKKVFCCLGCKTVFEILSDKNLTNYYTIEKNPGVKKIEEVFSDYSYLDLPEIRNELLSFSGGGIEKVTLSAPSIHCSSCIWLLENLNQINPNIIQSEVNFLKKEVSIQYVSEKISLRKAAEILDSIGYKPLVELKEKEQEKANKVKDLSYKYKLGIAGFAFGNIMLLSFPEYFSGGMYDDVDFGAFFGYVNLLLALPVFFYCSSSYFVSAWKGLRAKYLNIDVPISLGIFVLFLRSTYEVITTTGPGYFDSMTGLVFFLLIGRWFQNRTYQALSFERNYKSYFPLGVSRVKDQKTENIVLKDLMVDDEIVIHNGEIIPADSILLEGEANIDYSFVTGEALPIIINKGEKIYAGGRQRGGQIHAIVIKSFSQSYLMQLWKNENKEKAAQPDMNQLIDRVSHYFTAIIILIALITGVYWYVEDASRAFDAVGAVLIIACPCALALTIPFTYGNGLRILEKAGFYLRDARYIEEMSKIDTLVFDKTGTITSQKNRTCTFHGVELNEKEQSMVKSLSRNSAHPLSRIICDLYDNAQTEDISNFKEIEGKGLTGEFSGQELVLGSTFFTGSEAKVPGTPVHFLINGKYRGTFSVGNTYRFGLKELITKLKDTYVLQLITGDGEGEKANLEQYFGKDVKLKFKMDPFAKLEHIEKLQKNHHNVMMIGDGLNDAGAIKKSDVGVSISDDIYGFMPSSDAILEAESLPKLYDFLALSRIWKMLVISGFVISFMYNVIGLSFAVQGLLSPILAAILMPLSSITVVAFAILTTNISALKIVTKKK